MQTRALVNTMHTEHIRFRMSYNACTHTCALAHLSTYVVTHARTHTHTHTHTHTACKHPLSISLLLPLSQKHIQTHTHTQNTTPLFASFISYHYITYTSCYSNQHTRTSNVGGGCGFRESFLESFLFLTCSMCSFCRISCSSCFCSVLVFSNWRFSASS